MNKKLFNIAGWLILLGMTIIWIFYGYTNLFLLFIPIVTLCFSIYDGSIKKLKIVKKLTFSQILLIIGALILAIAIAFGFMLLAGYIIRDLLNLQGWIKTVSQFVAILLALFPARYLYVTVLLKVVEDVKTQQPS